MSTIKAGIIGTGFIGPAHVEAARRLGFVEMIGLCEAGDELAKSKASRLNIPKAYGSVEAFLADKEIEVVHNCTPNHLHFEISKKIMAAGKHVISEKPLAMTTGESKELVKLAAKAGIVNAIDFNYRYYPLVQEAKAMVESGKLPKSFMRTDPIRRTGCISRQTGIGAWCRSSAGNPARSRMLVRTGAIASNLFQAGRLPKFSPICARSTKRA